MRVTNFVFAIALLCMGATAAVAVSPIVVAGSDSVAPFVRAAANRYHLHHPDVWLIVGEGGSGHGIKAVTSGNVALGMVSRLLTEDEMAAHPDLNSFVIGYGGIAVVINARNPAIALTSEQLGAAFSGRYQSWKDFGGDDRPIQLVGLDQRHGTAQEFQKFLRLEATEDNKEIHFTQRGTKELSGHSMRCETHQDLLAQVSLKPNSIGFAALNLAQKMATEAGTIRLVQIDGVAPIAQNIADGRYTLARPLVVITKGLPTNDLAKFIEFMRGDEGQEILVQLGYFSFRN